MAKTIRFPLIMDDEVEVRTIEELKENFSLSRVLQYFRDGKLETWLRHRGEDDLADEIIKMDEEDESLSLNLCKLFEVEYEDAENSIIKEEEERKRKLDILKAAGYEDKYRDRIGHIAFDQDELFDLLDSSDDEAIYLYGERFSLPLGKRGKTYIGINNPEVVISSKTPVDWKEKNIQLIGVHFDSKYSEVENKAISQSAESGATRSKEFVEHQKHLDRLYENGKEVAVLYFEDDNGEEVRVSDNQGMNVVDFCECRDYIFYALEDTEKHNCETRHFIFRYEKANKSHMKMILDEGVQLYMDDRKYPLTVDTTVKDEEKFRPRSMFCSDNRLIIYLRGTFHKDEPEFHLHGYYIGNNGGLYIGDYDGKEWKVLIKDDFRELNYPLWIHKNTIWIKQWEDWKTNLLCYSIKSRKMERVAKNLGGAITDGEEVYLIEYNKDPGPTSMDIIHCSVSGGSKETIATVKKGEAVCIDLHEGLKIKDGKVYLGVDNKDILMEKGKVYDYGELDGTNARNRELREMGIK